RADEPAVEVDPRLVDLAVRMKHPGPRDREPVAGDAELGHQRDILGEPVVVIVGDITVRVVDDRAGNAGEGVPDAGSTAVLEGRPFDLIGRGRRPPDEVVTEV